MTAWRRKRRKSESGSVSAANGENNGRNIGISAASKKRINLGESNKHQYHQWRRNRRTSVAKSEKRSAKKRQRKHRSGERAPWQHLSAYENMTKWHRRQSHAGGAASSISAAKMAAWRRK
jgi:hypothetical protein